MHIEKDQRHIRLNEEGEANRSKGKENVTSKAAECPRFARKVF